MSEFSPLPQQPRSPERSSTPTNAAKSFLNKWEQRLWTTSQVLFLPPFVGMSLHSFSRGDKLGGIFWGTAAVGDVIVNGDKLVNWAKNKFARK